MTDVVVYFLEFADVFEPIAEGTAYWSLPHAREAAQFLANSTGRPVSLCVDDGNNTFEIQVFEPQQ